MSTFKGVIDEFPSIRGTFKLLKLSRQTLTTTVDYFRVKPGTQAPLACFLSHVHNDHLEGLESFKSPFLYCSAATREILIRLERKIHRVMFATGVTEVRKPQYKKLKNLLKPIPLETPTKIELTPGNEIQVTLFDANHCTGAVMFLFEGNGKAVLYTGDIRSEPWWINNLNRSPFMIEYANQLKTLDCIYLDTSNTSKMGFPTKADGLKELLQKVSEYPKDTIHVDTYKLRLYKSLRGNAADPTKDGIAALAHEGPVLTGYTCGNTPVPGCLTDDHAVRLHSCEKGMCKIIDENNKNIVWIRPIVTRTKDGAEMAEVGVGGGGEDLTRHPELDLNDFEQFLSLLDKVKDPAMPEVKKMLVAGLRAASQRISLNTISMDIGEDSLELPEILKALAQSVRERSSSRTESIESQGSSNELPRVITFPYSRHSSYDELCDLVRAFKPRDVYPCTVDEQYWNEAGLSISSLFGRLCTGKNFRHDAEMEEWLESRAPRRESQQTHTTTDSQSSHLVILNSPERTRPNPVGNRSEALTPRRDSLGQLKPFGVDGMEDLPTSETLVRTTPPRTITAVSPHSESQGLRRKAIHENFEDGEIKRVRLEDGSHSSPVPVVIPESTDPDHGDVPMEEVAMEADSKSSLDGDPSQNENDVDLFRLRISSFMDYDEQFAATGLEYPELHAGSLTSFDKVDGIFRCNLCGHELWGGHKGFCTGSECIEGPTGIPFIEVLDPEGGSLPQIAINKRTDNFVESDRLKLVVGPCLDYDSSAYDSQDSDPEFREDYDYEDTFIDDPNSDDEGGDDGSSQDEDPSKDEEPDYEAMYNQVRAQNDTLRDQQNNIIKAYDALHEEHRDLRREVGLYSSEDDESDEMDEDEMDDDGVLVVDVTTPNPVVTEIFVAQAQEQSQESEVTEDRIRARVEAFEAAQDGDWHDVTMMSTTGNHTFPEIEL
ncbi:uncharacterized protein PAC_04736 [Phialocephala subalpina]|uniref:Protein artemis n=1 Tax=Phialocephala subalpina TaxID=576137 RepID=A0A1L7WQ03_9HELO|nr:uncharacterized protein PAC_04736 [Phialocephala subalpina]